MTEPIASKYELVYWVKLIGAFVVMIAGIIIIIYTGGNNDSGNRLQNTYTTIGLFIAIIIGTMAVVITTFPRKIQVNTEQILIDYYVINKHIVINYTDIDKLSTTRPYNTGGTFSRLNNGQTLVIELYNGKRYNISENDFENYEGLKSAIYDHVFRHQ